MKAAIDIGTNTALLLIGTYDSGELEVIREEQKMPRLGKGVDAEKFLLDSSIIRVIEALKEFQQIIESDYEQVDEVIVTATSAVRDSANRQEFVRKVKEETGLDVRILSGDEEATMTYSGAICTLDDTKEGDILVLDIGGGSTEVALGRDGELKDEYSFDVGCVRFTERFLTEDPPYQEHIRECRNTILEYFEKKKFKYKKDAKAIGVAGTLTSLAAINLQIENYEPERINNHVINRENLSKGIEIFSLHTHKQLLELSPNILRGREDIFLAGLLILEEFLNFFELDEIIVSTGGIRHGVLLDAFNNK